MKTDELDLLPDSFKFPYAVHCDTNPDQERIKWTMEMFGDVPERWKCCYSGLYAFRDEKDAMLFALRWVK
jgi:hypothetical protein